MISPPNNGTVSFPCITASILISANSLSDPPFLRFSNGIIRSICARKAYAVGINPPPHPYKIF